MQLDTFVSDGVESLIRLAKYGPVFPFSSDYCLVSVVRRDTTGVSFGRQGYLGTEEHQVGIEA